MPSCYRTITPRDEQLPIYLCTVGHVHQNPMAYPNGAPHYHWLHTVKGYGTVVFQGETRTLSPGTGFLMYPHMPARYWPDTHPWEVMWVTFDGHSLDRFLQAWGMEPGFIELVDMPYLCSKVSDLLTRAGEEADYSSAILSSLLYAFLIDLGWQASQNEVLVQRRKRLVPALKYIDENFDRPISVNNLADVCGVTPQHLCRMFRSILGVTPISYLTTYRVSKAKELLLGNPELPVAEVAARTGFSSASYFSTVFRSYERTTPSVFRQMNAYAR